MRKGDMVGNKKGDTEGGVTIQRGESKGGQPVLASVVCESPHAEWLGFPQGTPAAICWYTEIRGVECTLAVIGTGGP
eukprot:423491-Pyramimonas_sp.AAC.2